MGETALVLGGGGVTGVAWELGVLAGLAEAGIDLTTADVVIGTSAGSSVGAQILSGVPLEELYAAQLAGPGGELMARMGPLTLASWGLAMLRNRDPQKFRARMGKMALAARTVPEAERRAVIASRLPRHEWPQRRLLVTAVDAVTGEFVMFDRDAGVSLVDAVAASCAVPGVWPPATIDGRRFIDGGVRSAINADLAAGHDGIVIIAPSPQGGGPIPGVPQQVPALQAAGAKVVVVSPDQAAKRAIGRNALDPARRTPAARAGRAQAAAVTPAILQLLR
jgi:NTE family protein